MVYYLKANWELRRAIFNYYLTNPECTNQDVLDNLIVPQTLVTVNKITTTNTWLRRNGYFEFDKIQNGNGKICGSRKTNLKPLDF